MTTTLDVVTVKRGSRGAFVEEAQRCLNDKLTPSPELDPDGIFGRLTEQAVRQFQRQEWLVVDGIVGPCTWAALKDWETRVIAHRVKMVPQPTENSCWAAATAMVLGRSNPVPAPPGVDASYAEGMSNDSIRNDMANTLKFARAYGLTLEPGHSWTVAGLARMLRNSPLMFHVLWDIAGFLDGRTGSSGHFVVVSGMRGAGGPENTTLRIHDPLPVGRGRIVSVGYGRLMRRLPGSTYQIFHR